MTIPPTRNQLPDDSFEPFEEHTRIPLPVFWIAIALALWGAVMLFHTEQSKTLAVQQRTAALRDLAAFSNEPGADLFAANCMTCHQANGSGVARAIPPLADSPFLKADRSVVVQILLHGINGPIAVEGNTYDGHMPSFASVLGDAEIARLGNFVRHHFAGQQPALDEQFVASQRARFAGRGAWTGGSEIASTLGAQIPGQPAPRAVSTGLSDPAILALVTQGRGDAWACASYHGGSGQGSGDVPRLAGLPAGYIANQLSQFASGKRRNDTMQVVARNLTPDEMIGIGRYYAGVYAPSTARPALGGAIDAATKGNKDERIFLRADKGVPYGELMQVMNLLRAAGYLKVGLVGLEDTGGGQP